MVQPCVPMAAMLQVLCKCPKNCNISWRKFNETTGMAIPSMSRMFESYSGVILHPSLGSHLTKRFEVYLIYPQFKFEFQHPIVQKMQYMQAHQEN
jgi:hypothetical protein